MLFLLKTYEREERDERNFKNQKTIAGNGAFPGNGRRQFSHARGCKGGVENILLTEDTADAVSEVSGSDDVSVITEQGPDADTESAGDETAADTLIADYIVDETVTDSVDGTYDAMAIEPEDEITGEEVSVSEDGFDEIGRAHV